MRSFLWSKTKNGKIRSKVAWDSVCLPYSEGGHIGVLLIIGGQFGLIGFMIINLVVRASGMCLPNGT